MNPQNLGRENRSLKLLRVLARLWNKLPSELFEHYGWELKPLERLMLDVLLTSQIVKEEEKQVKKAKRKGFR